MVEWDQPSSLLLLDEYNEARVLWDLNHPHYNSKAKRQEFWETIAKKFDVDVNEAQKKVNNLLNLFRRKRSKFRRSLAAGEEYQSKWFAYEKLKVIYDQRGSAGAREEIEDPLNSEMNNEELTHEVMLDDINPTNRQSTVSNKRPKLENRQSTVGNKRPKLEHRQSTVSNKRPKLKNRQSAVSDKQPKLECISNPQQSISYEKLPNTADTPVDEFDAIGKNVAAKLRCMKSTQRIVAEKLIHDTLFYGQLEKLTDKSCVHPNSVT